MATSSTSITSQGNHFPVQVGDFTILTVPPSGIAKVKCPDGKTRYVRSLQSPDDVVRELGDDCSMKVAREILEEINKACNIEPLPQPLDLVEEVKQQFKRGSYQATVPDAANLLVDTFGHEMMWVQDEKKWWLCSRTARPGYWSPENREGALARAKAVVRVMAENHNNPGWLAATTKYKHVLETARPDLAGRRTDFNSNPWLLGAPNGVIDLRTGELSSPVDPNLKMTLTTRVDYDEKARCPGWFDHLRVMTRNHKPVGSPGDPELIDYLQVLAGVSLVGEQVVHVVPFLYGEGRNGKGIFVDTMSYVLGDYAAPLDQTVLFSRPDAHTTGLTDLYQKRLVIADEVTGSQKINTALLKKLSGGGQIKARRMRQDNFDFKPTHTAWLVSNDKPDFGRDISEGLWARTPVIETGPKIPDEQQASDSELRERLRAEGPGILRWMVEGAVAFCGNGRKLPRMPVRVRAASEALKAEFDLTQRFIHERAVESPGEETLLSQWCDSFNRWAEFEGELPALKKRYPNRTIADWLRKHGVTVEPGTGNQKYVRGWKLKNWVYYETRF